MTETAVPDDLMKVARETIPDHPIAWDAPVLRNRVARALAAERERATLAERARCAALCAEAARLHRNGQQSAFDDGDFHRAEIQMKLAHNEEFLAAEIARP